MTEEKAKILVCTPLIETGVNIEGIDSIVIASPENYTAIQLMQMCGRTREEQEDSYASNYKQNSKFFYV